MKKKQNMKKGNKTTYATNKSGHIPRDIFECTFHFLRLRPRPYEGRREGGGDGEGKKEEEGERVGEGRRGGVGGGEVEERVVEG